MPADYGFRSGSGRLYQAVRAAYVCVWGGGGLGGGGGVLVAAGRVLPCMCRTRQRSASWLMRCTRVPLQDYGTIPKNVAELSLQNFRRELRALRRSVRYGDPLAPGDATPRGLLRALGAAAAGAMRRCGGGGPWDEPWPAGAGRGAGCCPRASRARRPRPCSHSVVLAHALLHVWPPFRAPTLTYPCPSARTALRSVLSRLDAWLEENNLLNELTEAPLTQMEGELSEEQRQVGSVGG